MIPICISIYCALLLAAPISAWDYMFERVENMNGSDTGHIIFDIRVERVNRTNFTITGNITFRSSFTRNPDMYLHSTNFFISPMGNNQYERMPIRFPKTTYCEYMNTNYRKYFMNSMRSPVSNFPYSDDPNADLCKDFRADHDLVFYIKQFVIDKSVVPPYVPAGLYRIETLIELDDSVVAGITTILRVEDDPDPGN